MKSLLMTLMIAIALAGCNGIAGPGHGEPYLVLKGKITNDEAVETPDGLRVALLWVNEEPPEEQEYGALKIAQETEINAEFPTFFQLSVDELPPDEAMFDLGDIEDDDLPPDVAGTKVSLGTIIVYHDGNDNHQLDLLDDAATESVDTVLGSPPEIILVYVEGQSFTFEDEGQVITLNPGFNVIEFTDFDALEVCDIAAEACRDQAETWEERDLCWEQERACKQQIFDDDPPETIPTDTEIVIELTSDPKLATMLCNAGGIEGTGGSTHITGGDIVWEDPESWPEDMLISCAEDGMSFGYYYQEVSGTICSRIVSFGEGTMEWPPFEPVPDWWPCEVP